MKPDVQREWVRTTGSLPMSAAAVQALRESGGNPEMLDRAERRLSMEKRDSARTRPGFGRSRIRNILNEEIEFVWGDQKPPKAALDAVVERSNAILAPAPAPKK
jgi:sn-glycerol 3-phosphate transport system substrate-binding protein